MTRTRPSRSRTAVGSAIGRGNGAHAPNEWFLIRSTNPKVAGLDEATMMYVDYLYEVAKLGAAR